MVPEIRLSPGFNKFYPGQPGLYVTHDVEFMVQNCGRFTIPGGFWYNGASIPKAFWQLTFSPFDPRILGPAAIHDWLYTCKSVPKDAADRTLFEYLRKNCESEKKSPNILIKNIPTIRPVVVESGVKFFGASAWKDSDVDLAYYASLKNLLAHNITPDRIQLFMSFL